MSIEEPETELLPSKSELKRQANALQELGGQLIELSSRKLAQVPISEPIRNAIEEYKRLPNSHGAKRRQLQYIGKLMRSCDYDEVSAAMHKLTNNDTKVTSAEKKWLKKILEEGEDAIEALVGEHPQANRQQLRQLHRNINRAADSQRIQQVNKLQHYLAELKLSE